MAPQDPETPSPSNSQSENTSKQQLAREVFTERAAFYTTSQVHTDPEVLARVAEYSELSPGSSALDVATGTGHTAFALAERASFVVGTDLTRAMLDEARALQAQKPGLGALTWAVHDAHQLPFGNESFDVVACRRAAHHFSDLDAAMAEMRRVLKPGGRLVIDDRSGPAATSSAHEQVHDIMNALDLLHDRSHVRQHTPEEWQKLYRKHGFDVTHTQPYSKHRPITSLTDGTTPEETSEIHRLLEELSSEEQVIFDLRKVDGVLHHLHWYVTVAGRKL